MFISADNSNELLFTCSMKGNENSINSAGHYLKKKTSLMTTIDILQISGRFTCPDDATWELCVQITGAPLYMHIYWTFLS